MSVMMKSELIKMPVKAPSICGCGLSVPAGSLCPCQRKRKLEAAKKQHSSRNRPSAHQRGYSAQWRIASKAYLALPQNHCCAVCGKPAQAVDHIKPHKGNYSLFWDKANWRPICISCNSRKAAREEGGFGRDRKA